MYRYFALIRTLPSTYFQTMLLAPVDLFFLWGTKNVYDVGLKTIIRLKAVTYASP